MTRPAGVGARLRGVAVLRRLAAVVAAGVAVASTIVVAPAAGAATVPSISLVDQTVVVGTSGTWHSELRLSGEPPGAALAVTVSARLTSRSAFTRALAGHTGPTVYPQVAVPVTTVTGPAGTVVVDIPVNPPGATTSPWPAFRARSGSSVYPVTFQLQGPSGPVGAPLVAFLVYSTGASSSFPPLAVALTVPLQAPPDPGPTTTRLDPAGSSRLQALAAALAAHPRSPVTLAASPDTLARLSAGDAADHQALAQLAVRATGGDEVLAAPYFPLDPPALAAAGLADQATVDASVGTATLEGALHVQPSTATAVVDGPLGPGALTALVAGGAAHLVVPDADLTPLPAADLVTTFGRPSLLSSRGAPSLPVIGTDADLSGLLGGPLASQDPVLAAHDVLAGLALVQLEAPSTARGVALEAPPGVEPDPGVLDGVLGGLEGNPFTTASTVDGLFGASRPAVSSPTRALVPTREPTGLPGAAALRSAFEQVAGLASLTGETPALQPLRRQLLSAVSSVVGPAQRVALATAVSSAVAHAEAGITLPGEASVTLTARRGTIPLTVLSSPSLVVHAEIHVLAPKVVFLPYDAGAGRCSVNERGIETCPVVLRAEATTFRLPVEARTGGVFPLDVTLTTPGGTAVLARNRDTVRSTAFSGVGVVLIALAGLGLAVWWARDLRHGRRARQLVEPPTGEVPVVTPTGPAGRPAPDDLRAASAEGRSWSDGDPVIERFFAEEAPRWRPTSPTGSPPGPRD